MTTSTSELHLKINAAGARAGSRDFIAATNAIKRAVSGLAKDTDGVFKQLKKTTETGSSNPPAAAGMAAIGTASRSAESAVNALSRRLTRLGDSAGAMTAQKALAQLNDELQRSVSTSADLRAAQERFKSAIFPVQESTKQREELDRIAGAYGRVQAQISDMGPANLGYQRAVTATQRAHATGQITAEEYRATLVRLEQEYLSAGNAATSAAARQSRFFGSMAGWGMHPGMGRQLGLQLNQIGQVVGMATSTEQALKGVAYQAADIGLAFGAVGTAIGAVAGVALPFLIDQLYKTESQGKRLDDVFRDAQAALDAYEAAARTASMSTGELSRRYGDMADQVARNNQALKEHALLNAVEDMRKAATEIDAVFGQVFDAYTKLENNNIGGHYGRNLRLNLERLLETTGLAKDEVRQLRDGFEALGTSTGAQQIYDSTGKLLGILNAAYSTVADMPPEMQKMHERLTAANNQAADLLTTEKGVKDETTRAAGAASGLATNLGTAADAARQLLATMGAVPGAVAALGRSVDDQIKALQSENRSLNLQLDVGLSSQAANRRVQMETLLGAGAMSPDQAASEYAKIQQLDDLAQQQKALRKRLSDSSKSTGGGGRVQSLGDETGQLQKLVKEMNRRTYALDVENEALRLVADGQAQNLDVAKLMIAAQREGAGAIDAQTQSMIDQYAAAQALNEQLQRLSRDPVKEWVKSVPSWTEAGRQIETEVFDSLANAIAEFAQTGKFDFESLGASILATATKIMAQRAVLELIGLLGGNTDTAGGGSGGFGLGDLIGSFFAKEGGLTSSPSAVNAGPMVSPSAFRHAPHYAQGTANTSGIPAMLHDNEAVIPLSGNRKVPVELNGGGANRFTYAPNFNWNVQTPDADSFRRSQKQTLAEAGVASRKAMRDIR